jgi:molybdopterin molybdotransferase
MGEDIKIGDTVLMSGMLIKPQDIALIASCGFTRVEVARMPRIGVISSGNELVEPRLKPGVSQIRNSNSYQLLAQIKRAGAIGIDYGIVKDDENDTLKVINQAIEENDIVLITGGVSMGDFDFVPAVLERAGVKILFSKINVQPGKPTTFGVHPNSLVFGLPGNPVSSFVQFELLVRPLISKMMGSEFEPVIMPLAMKNAFSRKNAERLAFLPVFITEPGFVEPVEYHGSAHISALSRADGIIDLPVGKKTIDKGEIVSVRQI